MSELVEREATLREARARVAVSTTAWAMITTQLMFLSFAFGVGLGPAPLRPGEFFAGALASVATGVIVAALMIRRRVEAAALVVLRVEEAGRRRRMAVFRDHVVIGEELVARERVRRVDSDGLELHLELADPGEPEIKVRRSFRAPRHLLARAADALRA